MYDATRRSCGAALKTSESKSRREACRYYCSNVATSSERSGCAFERRLCLWFSLWSSWSANTTTVLESVRRSGSRQRCSRTDIVPPDSHSCSRCERGKGEASPRTRRRRSLSGPWALRRAMIGRGYERRTCATETQLVWTKMAAYMPNLFMLLLKVRHYEGGARGAFGRFGVRLTAK